MPDNLGKAVLDLGANLQGLNAGLDQAKLQTSTAMGKMRGIGIAAVAGLGLAVAGFGTQSIAVAGNFEAGMNRVQAVSGATGDQLNALSDLAKQLGETTQFSATQAADAMGFLAQAGFEAVEIIGSLPSVLQLAAAANLDLATSADIASNILSGYGLEVSELTHANDVLVKTMTSTNTDLLQLGEAMKYAGPIASAAGVSFEEAAAAIGLMGNAGIQGSLAGTSLRGAISRILIPTNEMAEAMTAAGLSFTDSAGRLKPLDQIIQELEPHGKDAGLMMQLFGQRAGPAMAALVSQGSGALTDLQTELENSGGTAARIAAVQMQGFNGAMKSLRSAFESLQIAIGESGLLDFAAALVLVVADMSRAMVQFTKDITNNVKAIVGAPGKAWDWFAKKVGLATESVEEAEKQIKQTAKAIPKATAAVKDLTESIQKTGKAADDVQRPLFDLERSMNRITQVEREAAAELRELNREFYAGLTGALASATPPLIEMENNTASLNERFNEVAGTLTNTTAPAIGTFTNKAADQFENFANSVDHELSTLSGKMVHALITGDTSFAKAFKTMTTNLATSFLTDFINIATKSVTEFVTNVLKGQLLKSLSSVIGKLGDLKGAASSALSVAGGAAGQVGGAIGGGGVGQAATTGGGGALGIVGAVTGVVSAISSIIGNFQQRTTNDRLLAIATNTKFINDRLDITNNHFLLGIWQHLFDALSPARTLAMVTHLKNTDAQLTRIASQATKRDTTLERIARLEEQQLGKLDLIAGKVGQPQTVVISSEDPDKFGERVSESIRLNRGGLRETVEDLREEGAPA